MRVAFLTTGRFTLVDLGRELAALGHTVRVYSLVPPSHTARFGLPTECNRWLGKYVAPFYAAARVAPGQLLQDLAQHALLAAVDTAAARVMEPCDVLVAMSGIGVLSLDAARRRFGARVFLERSSRHILSQREILESVEGARRPVPPYAVTRELAGYGLADVISVPATHVVESFLERGVPRERLFLNPFGTSLEMFAPTTAPDPNGQPTILMVGSWSMQKGCDILVDAWRRLPGTKLLHVGPVGDAPLPRDALFEHVDPVPQATLREYYAQAHVCVLASRQEGLALVQAQALACGVKIVCSSRTGGADLRPFVESPESIVEVPVGNVDALANALRGALSNLPPIGSLRDLIGQRRHGLSWRAYAKRYEAKMREEVARRPEGHS